MEFPNCRICKCALNFDVVNVGLKGQNNLIAASKRRGDEKFLSVSDENIQLHSKCRAVYINERCIKSAEKTKPTLSSVQTVVTFDYQKQCLLCKEDASEDFIRNQIRKHQEDRIAVCRVTKQGTGETIIRTCLDGIMDEDSEDVRKRVYNKDLVTLNARYHKLCYAKFLNHRTLTYGKRGRPVREDVQERMERVYEYIDSNMDDAQFTIEELRKAVDVELPGNKTIKRKLIEQYGSNISIMETKGKPLVFCLISTAKVTLKEKWYTNKENDDKMERMRIVCTAANIVLEDMRSSTYETSYYPPPSSFLEKIDDPVPQTLKNFVEIIVTKYKHNPEKSGKTVVALCHSMMQAARPRSFKSPLLLGISSIIHQKYASRTLIDLLSSLGFCASYYEVTQFENSVIFHPQPEEEPAFKQFVFDNADFNVQTIDGNNTFHSMGGIQCNTPKDNSQDVPILKLDKIPKAAVIGKYGNISLQHYFNRGLPGLKNVTLKDYTDDSPILPTKGDALWLFGKIGSFMKNERRGWNSFMGDFTKVDKEYRVSGIQPLPFINHQPSDLDTVYTALREAQEKSKALCIVTFDQPLYQKAQQIVKANPEMNNIILRLGGFHLLMSFMGAMGYIMSGSGLKELWCTVYAAISTEKMMTGHSYARAVRAHFLTRTALFKIIYPQLNLTLEEQLDLDQVLDGDYGCCEKSVEKYEEQLAETLNSLENRGPTAKLWTQYFRMTTLMAQFIEAEKSGNWNLHISSVKKMLPYFYASGHFLYSKSATLYLQDMQNLHLKMTREEFVNFTANGFFTIRRTDKFWAGVWSDQTIEQTLMRSMKSSGGLTRGRGMTDSVLAKWILSTPFLSTVAEQVESFCEICPFSTTQMQHIDGSDAMIKRDNDDLKKFSQWLQHREPFRQSEELVSLSTGIVGGININCHDARSIGKQVMQEKVGQNFEELAFQRKKRVQPLSFVKSAVKIDDDKVSIEPETIFRRICFAKKDQEELKNIFEYELAPYPLSLFHENGMRKTKKSVLYDLCVPSDEDVLGGDSILYVIDGGFLLHKVVWKKGMNILTIGNTYINYLKKHFNNAIVVFDGYECNESNTKIAERRRRTKSQYSPDVIFDRNTVITTSQEIFLANEKNKDRFIKYLISELQNSGVSAKQSPGDADTLIVNTALQNCHKFDKTFIVGEDVDLLVVMCGLSEEQNVFLLKPGRGKVTTKYYATDCFNSKEIKDNIFFIHAVSGCDTTSAIFRQGKRKVANLVKNDSSIEQLISIFKNHEADPSNLLIAGEQFLRHLYGEKNSNLNEIRYNHFAKSVTKSKFNLACLPPSMEAAHQHIYRTYHQIQKWFSNEKPPTEWGWKLVNHKLEPVTTLIEPAPKHILSMISCKCKMTCKHNCTCKKSGLNCSVLCTNCDGRVCHGIDDTENNDDAYIDDLTGCNSDENPLDIDDIQNDDDAKLTEDTEDSESDLESPKRIKFGEESVTKTDLLLHFELESDDDRHSLQHSDFLDSEDKETEC